MNGDARLRRRADARVQDEARRRIRQAVTDVQTHLSDRTQADFFAEDHASRTAAHGYVAMDEDSLWIALHDLQVVRGAADVATTAGEPNQR